MHKIRDKVQIFLADKCKHRNILKLHQIHNLLGKLQPIFTSYSSLYKIPDFYMCFSESVKNMGVNLKENIFRKVLVQTEFRDTS